MAVKYRVHFVESERGWGQKWEHTDYDTREEAELAFRNTNAGLPTDHTPDYYYKADSIEKIDVNDIGEVFVAPQTKKETATERRAREAREERAQEEKWEAEKPMRLLRALGRARELGLYDCNVFYKSEILYYTFDFGGEAIVYYDPIDELSEYTMQNIESDLEQIFVKKVKARRLAKIRNEVLERLSAEEKEALGL